MRPALPTFGAAHRTLLMLLLRSIQEGAGICWRRGWESNPRIGVLQTLFHHGTRLLAVWARILSLLASALTYLNPFSVLNPDQPSSRLRGNSCEKRLSRLLIHGDRIELVFVHSSAATLICAPPLAGR